MPPYLRSNNDRNARKSFENRSQLPVLWSLIVCIFEPTEHLRSKQVDAWKWSSTGRLPVCIPPPDKSVSAKAPHRYPTPESESATAAVRIATSRHLGVSHARPKPRCGEAGCSFEP